MSRSVVIALALALGAGPLAAQQPFATGGPYDPAVPTPGSVLGYELGTRFTPHHLLARYLARLAATSRRIRVDTVARSFEGRAVFLVIATSEANQARLEQIRGDAARLADPRGASPAELSAAAARLPAIVWLGYTVHGGEASGVEAAIALAYQLAAGGDRETRLILDSTVVLIDPVENPDGHERHVEDVTRARGAGGALDVPTGRGAMVQQGSWPGPRLSHYGFDLNRDWFIMSHPETRGRVASFRRWWPQVAADLHEMGSNSTYYFAPPMEPINKNVPASIARWWDVFAAANADAFAAHGWSFFRRESFDEFYPSYGDSWPILNGAVGMTYEQASSGGGAIRREDGTILTLRDAAWHHYTSSWATLLTAARRSRELVRDYLAFRQSATSDGERAVMRDIAIARDAQGRADSLAARLLMNGIEVGRLTAAADLRDATAYGEAAPRAARLPAGAYVVDLAQPQGRLARALLEPDAQLDSGFIAQELERRRTGQPNRFYDLTAWSLPYVFRVQAWWTRGPVGPIERVDSARLAADRTAEAPAAAARYAYAFAPGSEASVRLLGALLADSVRVYFAPRGFREGTSRFPAGAFLVRLEANGAAVGDLVRRRAAEAGARVEPLATALADSGTDLGSNTVFYVRPPRVGLIGGSPISGTSFGAAWYAFDQRLHYPVTTVNAATLGGLSLEEFDVLVLPSVSPGAFDRALGDGGKSRLVAWVKGGGTLVALDGAMSWVGGEHTGLARLRLRRDTTRADSAGGAPLPDRVPGALVRLVGDTLSPLMAGVGREVPALVVSNRIYSPPKDLAPGEAVLRYAPLARLRLAGYLWPEVPARLAGSVYLWTESVGRGRVIGFAGDPNFRDLLRGLLPLFANAVFLGPSM
jgi:hypothetical protein